MKITNNLKTVQKCCKTPPIPMNLLLHNNKRLHVMLNANARVHFPSFTHLLWKVCHATHMIMTMGRSMVKCAWSTNKKLKENDTLINTFPQ